MRHHRSIAVAAAPTACFALEVQCQRPAAPGLLDLSLHLGWQDQGGPSGAPLTPLPCHPNPAVPPSMPLHHSALGGDRGRGYSWKIPRPSRAHRSQHMVSGCRQLAQREPTRLEWPRGWLSRWSGLWRTQPWGCADTGLCQRLRTSPHPLAHPGLDHLERLLSAFRTSSGVFLEERRKNWVGGWRGRGRGAPGISAFPPALPHCAHRLLTSPLQKQYMMATKNPCGERRGGQGLGRSQERGSSGPAPSQAWPLCSPGRS